MIGDILLRMPLSVFVKVINVTVEVEGLEEYLGHPIRKHYLVKHLPVKMRQQLLYNRKYISSTYELLTKLAYQGIAQFGQFGPQLKGEKDQVP